MRPRQRRGCHYYRGTIMTIVNGQTLKIVQAIDLPNTVEAINIFYFESEFIADQTDDVVLDAMEAWVEDFYTPIDDYMGDAAAMGLMQGYYLTGSPFQWIKIGERTPTVTLADTGSMLAHGVSALLRGYTTRGKTIGRKYIPSFTETGQADGAWVAAALTALAATAVKWGTAGVIDVDNKLKPGVWSTTTGFLYQFTDEFVVPTYAAYQRRRRPGVGS